LTAKLIIGRPRLRAVLPLGDAQYPDGALKDFRAAYARTWGRVLAKSHPVPGNHEYRHAHARGYSRYFGSRAGTLRKKWYSYRIGRWHLIALDGNCGHVGGCAPRHGRRHGCDAI
jgi:hypothetical protein